MIRQMVSDAQVNDSNRFQAQGGQTTVNFRIPSNKVGLVIGRGGETLKDFQERSKAKIMIASDSYGDRNHERVITLVGDENSTQQARKLIEELIFGSTNVSFYIRKDVKLNKISLLPQLFTLPPLIQINITQPIISMGMVQSQDQMMITLLCLFLLML